MPKLRTQDEILASWGGKTDTVVSVSCITYNHEPFIRDAIEGFLIQETDFPFEVLIHDDASTDKTADIIREYEALYPAIIKPIYQRENQHSKGIRRISQTFNYSRAEGAYIAECEGDDYWTDSTKLQQQVLFHKDHPDCSLTFHAINIVDATDGRNLRVQRNSHCSRFFDVDSLILGGGGFVGTQSIVMRRDVTCDPPSYYDTSPAGDYPLVLTAALRGQVYYLDKVMASYRVTNPLSAMGLVNGYPFERYVERWKKTADMLFEFDSHTENKYRATVRRKASSLVFNAMRKSKSRATLRSIAKMIIESRSYLRAHHFLLAWLLLIPAPATRSEAKHFVVNKIGVSRR